MKGFMVPDLTNANVPTHAYAKKVELRKKDIVLTHLISKDMGKTYKIVFLINNRTKVSPYSERFRISSLNISFISIIKNKVPTI